MNDVKCRPGAEKAVQAHQEERGRSPGLSPGEWMQQTSGPQTLLTLDVASVI